MSPAHVSDKHLVDIPSMSSLTVCLVPGSIHQAFSDYQLQQMTSNFIDQFGFNEEEFNEQEGRVE